VLYLGTQLTSFLLLSAPTEFCGFPQDGAALRVEQSIQAKLENLLSLNGKNKKVQLVFMKVNIRVWVIC
jgi:hypothetical protein